MNDLQNIWPVPKLLNADLTVEIPADFIAFFEFLNVSSRAYYFLNQAFKAEITKDFLWNFERVDDNDKDAAKFASTIYKRGQLEHNYNVANVYFGNVEFADVFTICDRSFYELNKPLFVNIPEVIVDACEKNKSIAQVVEIFHAAKNYQLKNWQIIGGGIVLDTGLFAADLLGQDVDIYPTTFLAMIDVAIGGKCGVNYLGKNQLGRFASPKNVFINASFLDTLPIAEIRAGCSEAIKHALIMRNFDLVTELCGVSVYGNLQILKSHLNYLVSVKADIVAQDFFDKGPRQILNFGHSVAHGIEAVTDVGHGEAVAIGMVLESFLALKIGQLSEFDFRFVKEALDKSQIYIPKSFQVALEKISDLLTFMKKDKKNKDSEHIGFALPKSTGFNFDFKNPLTFISLKNVESFLKDLNQWK